MRRVDFNLELSLKNAESVANKVFFSIRGYFFPQYGVLLCCVVLRTFIDKLSVTALK